MSFQLPADNRPGENAPHKGEKDAKEPYYLSSENEIILLNVSRRRSGYIMPSQENLENPIRPSHKSIVFYTEGNL